MYQIMMMYDDSKQQRELLCRSTGLLEGWGTVRQASHGDGGADHLTQYNHIK